MPDRQHDQDDDDRDDDDQGPVHAPPRSADGRRPPGAAGLRVESATRASIARSDGVGTGVARDAARGWWAVGTRTPDILGVSEAL